MPESEFFVDFYLGWKTGLLGPVEPRRLYGSLEEVKAAFTDRHTRAMRRTPMSFGGPYALVFDTYDHRADAILCVAFDESGDAKIDSAADCIGAQHERGEVLTA